LLSLAARVDELEKVALWV